MASDSPPPRPRLTSKARKYRTLTKLLSWLDRHLSFPLPPKPTHRLTIQWTISKTPASIELYFFTDRSSPISPIQTQTGHQLPKPTRPVLINFHGGGFTLGHPIDDARWLGTVLKRYPGAVLVSVGYRLAPEYPFPIAIEDGVDALLWLKAHAGEYNLDTRRFVLCGASAGGNLAFTVLLRLHEELQIRGHQDQERTRAITRTQLAGAISFYPTLDSTKSRQERDATNPISAKESKIPHSAFEFFDEACLVRENLPKKTAADGSNTEEVDMAHPYVSPALAPTALLGEALPSQVPMYTCGWDQLLVEGNRFRERLVETC